MAKQKQVTGWVGWVYFAAVLMMLAGILQTIVGFMIISNDTMLIDAGNGVVILSVVQWGWLHALFGIIVFLSAFSLMGGRAWGRLIAAILLIVSTVANFTSLEIYPVWSVVIIAMNLVILYAVLVHGGEAKE